MLSQKTRYAIRAVQHLADHYGEGPVQLAAIAEDQNIPAKFLTVILSELTRYGLVASQRGREGGVLACDPAGRYHLWRSHPAHARQPRAGALCQPQCL